MAAITTANTIASVHVIPVDEGSLSAGIVSRSCCSYWVSGREFHTEITEYTEVKQERSDPLLLDSEHSVISVHSV
jgi:hypothetical protein